MIGAILIWGLIVVLALLLLALAMPLRLELLLSKQEAVQFTAALRPFGRFGPRISLSDRGRKKPKAKAKPDRPTKKRGTWKINPKRVVRASVRLVMDLVGLVRLEAASFDLRFGLGDPAETGQVFGQMTPLIYGTSGMPRVHVDVQPAFDRALLEGRVALDMSLVPLRILPPFARFGWAAFGPGR